MNSEGANMLSSEQESPNQYRSMRKSGNEWFELNIQKDKPERRCYHSSFIH